MFPLFSRPFVGRLINRFGPKAVMTVGVALVVVAAGGYTAGFVTGNAGSYDRVDTLENALRECLGLGPIPAAGDPPGGS